MRRSLNYESRLGRGLMVTGLAIGLVATTASCDKFSLPSVGGDSGSRTEKFDPSAIEDLAKSANNLDGHHKTHMADKIGILNGTVSYDETLGTADRPNSVSHVKVSVSEGSGNHKKTSTLTIYRDSKRWELTCYAGDIQELETSASPNVQERFDTLAGAAKDAIGVANDALTGVAQTTPQLPCKAN